MNGTKYITAVAVLGAMVLIFDLPRANAGVIEYVENGSFETLSSPSQPANWDIGAYFSLNTGGFAEDGNNSLSTPCSGPNFGCLAEITQTLSDIGGQTLTGSLWYLPGDFGPPNDLSVLINGVSVLDVSDATSGPGTWLQETFSFTATGSDQLQVSVWNTPATSFIDNISVTGPDASTPEPGTEFLLIAGLGFFGLSWIKRQRKTSKRR